MFGFFIDSIQIHPSERRGEVAVRLRGDLATLCVEFDIG
jgi:hypothetical protein